MGAQTPLDVYPFNYRARLSRFAQEPLLARVVLILGAIFAAAPRLWAHWGRRADESSGKTHRELTQLVY